MTSTFNQSGYVTLIAVLIIGAAAGAISIVLLMTGIDSQRAALVSQQSKQARGLATACAQEALRQIHDDTALTNDTLALGQGNCTYTISTTGASTRTIAASGTVGNVVKKIQIYVTIGASNISITSWQEVS